MFSYVDVQLQQNSGVSPEKSRPSKKAEKRFCEDIDQGNRVDTLKESPEMTDTEDKKNPPSGPSRGGLESVISEGYVRQHSLAHWSSQVWSPENELETNARAILMALFLSLNEDGEARVTYDDIKKITGIGSDPTIKKYIRKLVKLNWIEITHDEAPDGEHWRVYKILNRK